MKIASLARRIVRNESGAIAATYALSLIPLIALAGIAYDFAQAASLDTEVQNAADQAALAAATQLAGTSTSITNATSAASNMLLNNSTMAAPNQAVALTVSGLTFYKTAADAEADASATTDPLVAKFVRVQIASKSARFTLTPIVGAVVSGNLTAYATAGLGTAICKVPPVMMCNPAADPSSFDVNNYIGKGFMLVAKGAGGSYVPGNFGFLDVGAGASDLGKLLGYGSPPGNCVDVASPTTQPGSMSSVINDFNTRFDIFDNGDSNNCYGGSLCPPSDNSRKDVVQSGNQTSASSLAKKDCGFTTGSGGNGWRMSAGAYRPAAPTSGSNAATCSSLMAAGKTCRDDGNTAKYPDAMGYPRDFKHAWANPNMNNDRIGDGTWDVDAYWRVNHGAAWAGQVATAVSGRSYPTRYELYKWERGNPTAAAFAEGSTSFQAPMCRAGSSPGGSKPDRRIIPVAVVNCTGLSGSKPVTPIDWVDAFLVEPSLDRKKGGTSYTNLGDIYVEIIGRTTQGSSAADAQVVRRDKPYLLK